MAVIQRKSDGRRIYVRHQLVIGRAATCDLVLDVSSVSAHHAAIRWDGSSWLVADLGSRNGTHVNGQHLAPRSATLLRLSPGDELTFAEREEVWVFLDDSPPQCLLIPEDARSPPIALGQESLIAWPSEENAVAYVFLKHGVWHVEDAQGAVQRLRSGQTVALGGASFTFHSPGPVPETPPAHAPIWRRELANAVVYVRVAPNEESAGLRVEIGGETLNVSLRTHLYLFAYLARERHRPRAGPDAGWVSVDQACRDLSVDPQALSVLVHRCRKDFESLRFDDASRVIERTRGLLQVGLQAPQLFIEPHGIEA